MSVEYVMLASWKSVMAMLWATSRYPNRMNRKVVALPIILMIVIISFETA